MKKLFGVMAHQRWHDCIKIISKAEIKNLDVKIVKENNFRNFIQKRKKENKNRAK